MIFAGARDHDAPGARQHGLCHLDRLARRGAVWQPPPVRRRRFLALRLIGKAILTATWMALIVGALVVT